MGSKDFAFLESYVCMNKMKRIITTIGLPALGALIVLNGFVYDILFAGLPYQDPTPELQARYDLHADVASVFYNSGGIALLIGLLIIPFIWRRTRKDECQQSPVGNDLKTVPEE